MPEDQQSLKLTDFMDLSVLQEIQDGFGAIAGVNAIITDAQGNVLTSDEPSRAFINRRDSLAEQEETIPEWQRVGREFVAPITIGESKLGMLRMRGGGDSVIIDDEKAQRLARRFNLDPQLIKDVVSNATKDRNRRPAAVQFLFLLANAIAKLCYQEYQLRQHILELETVSRISQMLAEAGDLQRVLDRTTNTVAELLDARSCSIRLLDIEKDELIIKSVHNLSSEYLNKGKIPFTRSMIDQGAFAERGYEFVNDMRTDPRVLYPQEAQREGIVSMLSVGMRYQGKPIGVLRLYSGTDRTFTKQEINLLRGISAAAAAAIANTWLADENRQKEALEQQINMAADVQQRMIPQGSPPTKNLDLAAVYVPCYQLGGDLYDFITLPYDNIGLVIADVSGKGLPASLIMASVRTSLRAQVDNVYYLDEIIRRVNSMLVRDTKTSEFVTLFYGVLDQRNRRLTYINAGHFPALLLRESTVTELGANEQGSIVLGVMEGERFKQSIVDLKPGDTLLLYTDGLLESRNASDESFGKQRIIDAFKNASSCKDADSVARSVLLSFRQFVGDAAASDDVTMVVARMK